MKTILILFLLLMFVGVACAPPGAYTVINDTVFINDSNVYLSATPHTLASSGWVYFNLTSKVYDNDIDMVWGFNTTVSKPSKAELYAPHWVNTTSQHSYTFLNVSSFSVYSGTNFDYGNVYNTNYSYTAVHEVATYNETSMEPNGTEWITSNASFDSFVTDGTNYTVTWHDRHDSYVLWKDYTHSFTAVNFDYQDYNKWYYVKNLPISSGVEYTMRAWVDVPVGLTETSGKYYIAVKPSTETIPQAVSNGHFYALDPWWNSSWGYYKSHTLNQTMINDSIGTGHYTLLVEYTDSDLITKAQADGDDIVFLSSDNSTQLPHQLSKFNSTTGYIKAYVGLSDITNVTFVNMYYGNSGATNTENKSGTWGENASGIWLMDEGTGSYANDSSGNGNNGTITGAEWNVTGGLNFTSDYVDCGSDDSLDDLHTKGGMSIVSEINPRTAGAGSTGDIFSKRAGQVGYVLFSMSNDALNFQKHGSTTLTVRSVTSSIAYNQSQHIAVTWGGSVAASNVHLYAGGVELAQAYALGGSSLYSDATQPVYLGGGFDGLIKYTYIYNRVLSSSEISTLYNNTDEPELFISTGSEQTATTGDTTAPTHTTGTTNNTIIGQSTLFSIQYDDDTALHTLGQYIFATNNSGSWVNESAINWTATPQYANVTKTLNSTVDTTVGYRWYADDNASNTNNTPIYTVTTTSAADTTDPTYSSAAHSTVEAGASCTFSIQYDDDTALHTLGQYIFATNNSGSWVNESLINFTATPSYANKTKTLTTTHNQIVGYRWYADDNSDNTNNTPIYTLTVQDTVPPLSTTGLSNSTGNFWHNWTWSNPVSDFNHTTVYINDILTPNTSNEYYNLTASAHNTSKISIKTVDATGNVNTTWTNHTSTIPNNPITITNVLSTYSLNEGETLNIDADYTDVDSDTGTFNDNSTEWNVNTATGVIEWITTAADGGIYYYEVNVTDGYGSTDEKTFTVTVNDTIYAPTVTLLSQTPQNLYQNSSGHFNLSWGIEHSTAGLNNTTLAMIYTLWDVTNDNFNTSLRIPSNDRADECVFLGENILRADDRNNTLNFENNATITEGNIYKWGGADENTSRITIIPVNDTYTKVYWNGTTQDSVWSGTWYLDRSEQQNAAMTPQSINKQNHILLQAIVPGCGIGQTGQIIDMYVDAFQGVSDPVKPLAVFYLNDSYDPLGGVNPESSPYAYLVTTMNATQWYSDDYLSYANSITVNTSLIAAAGITPTTKFYVYFNTEEATSKSYTMNATNVATSTNRSFAQTDSMWIGDNAPFTPHAYTPNVFFISRSNESQYQTKMYIADNDGLWNNSSLQVTNIEVSTFPPSTPGICSFYYDSALDYDMNETYNGEYFVRVLTANDPDGGTVNHNLTLHYANQTFIATINDTITSNGVACLNVTFNSVPYYSTTDEYKLKVVATDDEADTATYWLPVNFTLYETPNATTLTNTTGNFWVNYEWLAGTGANTDSYNVSLNSTWYNGTSSSANNTTVPHGSIEIIIYAYNESSGLSTGFLTDNVTLPNNPITIIDIQSSYSIDEGDTLSIDANYTDADGDTGTFNDNSSEWNVNSATGVIEWVTVNGNDGIYYYEVNVSDGYGSTDTKTFTVTVNDTIGLTYTPPDPVALSNSTGNFWVNYTWSAGIGNTTDSYNVSYNGTWDNTSSVTHRNESVGAHGHLDIIIYAYNTTDGGTLSTGFLADNVTVPNNNPTLSGLPNSNTNEDTPINNAFDLDDYFTDADGDTPSYSVQSNNQSGNVIPTINGDNTVDYDLASNWYGTAEIVFKVEDGYGGSDTDTVLVTVSSVNDPPTLTPIGNQNVNEGEVVTILIEGFDTETSSLSFTCNRTDLFTDFSISGGWTEWVTNYTSAGIYHVLFEVTDGTDSDNETVIITVSDTPLTITSYWNNQTGNSLSLTVATNQGLAFGVITNRTANVSWYRAGTLAETDMSVTQANYSTSFSGPGTYYINASATDNIDTTVNTTFTVQVGQVYSISGYVHDTNGTALSDITVYDSVDSDVTNATGYYQVVGYVNGSYTLTAAPMGYTEGTVFVTVAGNNIENANITLSDIPPEDNTMPLPLFITWSLVLFGMMYVSYPKRDDQDEPQVGIRNVTPAFLSVILAFVLAKVSINGQLVQTFAGVSSADVIVTGTQAIQISWLGWLFTFIGLAMVILTVMLLVTMYRNTYDEVTE